MDSAFLKGETWGEPGSPVAHIETHGAHVFLVGSHAYKIKKDVKLPYLDFSTLEKRRAVIAREFELNRGFAPEIYLGTVEVRGEPALKMHRFEDHAILSHRVARGHIDRVCIMALADMAVAAHRRAERRDMPGAQIMNGLGAQLSEAFTSSPDIFPAAQTLEFHALYEEALKRLRSLLNRRTEDGLVRRCHGDMHCGNIVVFDGRPVLFDAIEFSEKIAVIDVLYDLAFLLMDLLRHGRAAAANAILNRYLQLRRLEEDLGGLAALPLFLATRAGVRALVTADLVHELAAGNSLRPRGEALDYFRASIAYLKPPRAALVCIGGISGTGKTVLAEAIAPDVGAAPGAIHLRTDVERKAMAGIAETQRLPAESYTAGRSAEVYRAVLDRAHRALKAGHSVVLDAVFARESERKQAERMAHEAGATFRGLWLEAPRGVLKARALARSGDASDATADVIEQQLQYDLGYIAWERIDATPPPANIAAAVRGKLPCRRAGPA